MANNRVVTLADLNGIYNNLSNIHAQVQSLNGNVNTVNENVMITADRLNQLAQVFRDYVEVQGLANRLNRAETRLVQIRQDIEKKFGHHDQIRRTTLGILQATDLGLVRKDTITFASEELMLSTPGYWLAPCLVALAAWINDKRDLAEQALKEALKRDDEKTSLFWALVCRRADRKSASLKWLDRYLAGQNEENLDRKAMIVLDAYASGLFGGDAEGLIAKRINKWMDHLSEKPGFLENQKKQWADAILLKRKSTDSSSYTYLKTYSHTYPALTDVMAGAELHGTISNYFQGIFEKKSAAGSLKEQLDDILESLITSFDEAEIPDRKREKFEQLVVDAHGNEALAKKQMEVADKAFETHKDFTQLLTDAAMSPDVSHSSAATQKFSIALSKDWILEAYNDITAENRAKVPHEIEINVDTFNDKTVDGSDEEAILGRFSALVDKEEADALAKLELSPFDKISDKAGLVIGLLGVGLCFDDSYFLGGIAIVAGILLYMKHSGTVSLMKTARENVKKQFAEKREKGSEIIRALLAEVVDFRSDFEQKDQKSSEVTTFLSELEPDQYVKKLAGDNRHIAI